MRYQLSAEQIEAVKAGAAVTVGVDHLAFPCESVRYLKMCANHCSTTWLNGMMSALGGCCIRRVYFAACLESLPVLTL